MQSTLFFTGKVCRKCRQEKPFNKFYQNERGKYGRSSYCIKCEKEKQNRKYEPVQPSEKICALCRSKYYSKYATKYCDDCTPKYNDTKKRCKLYYYNCKNCGKLSVTGDRRRQSYCSHRCYSQARTEYLFDNECITCGSIFKSLAATAKYCSKKCRKRVSNIYHGECIECGDHFVSRYARKYCSDRCMYRHSYSYDPVEKVNKICSICKGLFTTTYRNSTFCSDSCREEGTKINNNERKSHRRRADKYGSFYQKLNRHKVFKSDNYKCQSCGVRCLKSKIGTNHRREPTLDHIIPISKGGPHSYNNVQTLCRKCNNKKSNKIAGQIPMLYNASNIEL